MIIKIFDLFKFANVSTSFVSSYFVVDISFDFVNLFFDKNFSICRNENYQNLYFIVFVKFYFFIYFELLFYFVININHRLFINFKFVRIYKRNLKKTIKSIKKSTKKNSFKSKFRITIENSLSLIIHDF